MTNSIEVTFSFLNNDEIIKYSKNLSHEWILVKERFTLEDKYDFVIFKNMHGEYKALNLINNTVYKDVRM